MRLLRLKSEFVESSQAQLSRNPLKLDFDVLESSEFIEFKASSTMFKLNKVSSYSRSRFSESFLMIASTEFRIYLHDFTLLKSYFNQHIKSARKFNYVLSNYEIN